MEVDADAKDNANNLVNIEQESSSIQLDQRNETLEKNLQESELQESSILGKSQIKSDATGNDHDVTNLYPTIVNFFTFQLRKCYS